MPKRKPGRLKKGVRNENLAKLLNEPSVIELAHPKALVQQVGGTHYGQHTGLCPNCGNEIQHWDLYAAQPYLEGTATGYVTRWRSKGGVVDLRKAISVIEKIIAIEELRANGGQKPRPKCS